MTECAPQIGADYYSSSLHDAVEACLKAANSAALG